ncbi:Z1 domain-containing protein [Promicromonospora citrea]|uniref:Endonuclease n=1 Tax=Promicromonospora citrea TaxID=43677 RepID=A0A8H9L8I6_9MICO|nr:Z1 domain-containing protein [Promicromonospora citrea]GGM37870.1 endonuclease [Promicromonospora citrea]
MTDDSIDMPYGIFLSHLEYKTPSDALKELLVLGVPTSTVEAIRARFEESTQKVKELDEPSVVERKGRPAWYTGPKPTDRYWPAVEKILRADGWGDGAIASLDDSSTRIVSLLNHPNEKTFRSRGLVVGYVQSGKTTSYTSVVAKAADRGYRFVIVLSGIHNGLRRQTQNRLVKQLVDPNPSHWFQLTSAEHDFVPPPNPAAFFGKASGSRVLCVVKKNGTVLRKLAAWLEAASQHLVDTPTLIIDDESDQATVATERINPLILRIMEGLPRSVYLGYTATPFANLLINPAADDLYPRDFVVNLPKPVGHFGTEVIFGRDPVEGEEPEDAPDGYDMVRIVPDEDVSSVRPMKKADVDTFSPTIVGSLRDALEYFLLVTAARRVRGTGNPHSTMLVHTSVNTAVHLSYREPLRAFLSSLRADLATGDAVDRLRDIWEAETKRVPADQLGETPVVFDDLLTELPDVIRACRVVMDNSRSEDRLDYENGPVVAIAVGGNTLSRGLTLEGLSVSYFVRAVSAYDTLLQMGRWFGFRHGYADLPRVWMTEELAGWFRHLAVVEHEMRDDIDRYMSEDITPLEFAVRLRTHPALLVTARAKMKDAVTASAAYGGQRLQTHYFRTDRDWLLGNIDAAKGLVKAAVAEGIEPIVDRGRYVFHGVSYTAVLGFLTEYSFHEEWAVATTELLTDYIQKRVRAADALRRWNIAVIGNPAGGPKDFSFGEGVTVGRVVRARLKTHREGFADIKTLMSRKDAVVDLSGDHSRATEKDLMRLRTVLAPDTGLLALYPIDKDSEPATAHAAETREPLAAEEHVIGVGLVFPEVLSGDVAAHGYIQADLSGISIEDEDYSALEDEE